MGPGLLACALVPVLALQRRHRVHPLNLLVLAAFASAVLIGGICVAGGAMLDRDVPSIEESLKPRR